MCVVLGLKGRDGVRLRCILLLCNGSLTYVRRFCDREIGDSSLVCVETGIYDV